MGMPAFVRMPPLPHPTAPHHTPTHPRPQVLTCILDGLADEAEGVRDAALAAGRVAVELYAESSLALVLPAVEAGITNANWRIRQSSVELLGDLLFKVGGGCGEGVVGCVGWWWWWWCGGVGVCA